MNTFSIIKPDAIAKGHQQAILRRLNNAGFKIQAMNNARLKEDQAREFYSIHKDKPFYEDLIKFMTSGNVCLLVLQTEGEAVESFRKLIGDTDPTKSATGTIRNLYGTDVAHNAIHGADSLENAKKEILFFFPDLEPYLD
jgi:nucleoside-diphosphate kinase